MPAHAASPAPLKAHPHRARELAWAKHERIVILPGNFEFKTKPPQELASIGRGALGSPPLEMPDNYILRVRSLDVKVM